MRAHDALAALLHDAMTYDAGNGCPGTCEGIAATLHAAGVRVTGDAGLDVEAYLDSIPVMTAEELRRRWPASVERLLRDAVRTPDVEALRLLAEHAIDCPDLDYIEEADVIAAARAALAPATPEAALAAHVCEADR